jgi:hypothetical protein
MISFAAHKGRAGASQAGASVASEFTPDKDRVLRRPTTASLSTPTLRWVERKIGRAHVLVQAVRSVHTVMNP